MSNNTDNENLVNDFLDNKVQTFEFWEQLLDYGFLDNHAEVSSGYRNFDPPWAIVNHMIDLSKIDLNTTILEPAFNHGVFLLALLEHMKFTYKMSATELLHWFNTKVTAYEENPLKCETVKNLIVLYFFKSGLDIKPHQLLKIYNENFIKTSGLISFHDIALGAIPYNLMKDLPFKESESIKRIYPSTRPSENEVSGAYFEQLWNFTQRFCLLSSSAFIDEKSKGIGSLLLPKITHLINFEKIISQRIFKNVSILHGFTHLKQESCFYSKDIYQSFHMESKEMISSYFDLDEASFNSTIFQPMNPHDFFIVKKSEEIFKTLSGKPVEKELCIPYIDFSLNNFKECHIPSQYIIYPYHKFSLIPEFQLERFYPQTADYFQENEQDFLDRDLGKGYDYEDYYAFPNQFGISSFLPEKVLVIPLCIGEDIKPYTLITKEISESENFFFKGAFLIDGSNDYVNKQFQEKAFLAFLQEKSTPWSTNKTNYFKVHFTLIQQFLSQL